MIIQKKNIKDIIPADYNPGEKLNPGDPLYEKIKKSIQTFGYVSPLVWNELTNRLVGGHQRLQVLIDLGYPEVDVSVVTLSEAMERVLNIALKKISGDWDHAALESLLAELKTLDIDMDLSGFSKIEIDHILNKYDIPELNQVIDENILAELHHECLDCGFKW